MENWTERCHKYTFVDGSSGFQINFAGMAFTDADIEAMSKRFVGVHEEMLKIERGEIKNPDENRKVTHFTDRSVYTGSEEYQEVEAFAEAIRSGRIVGSTGKKFEAAFINGIGGSALGPQLIQMAINGPYWNEKSDAQRNGYLKIYFLDNTDTAGLADALQVADLEKTLVVNISKSGGTQETKNNMIVCREYYEAAGLDFTKHACAITMKKSELDQLARGENWLKVFEMAESIGGRTSETSIVGHLPAAEADGDLAAVALGQEFLGISQLYIEVVDVNAGRHAHFLNFHHALVLPRLLLPLLLLELELAVVHELADRGNRGGGDLDQIQALLHGLLQSISGGHDAQLSAVGTHQTHLSVPNLLVELMTLFADRKAPPIR